MVKIAQTVTLMSNIMKPQTLNNKKRFGWAIAYSYNTGICPYIVQ